MSKRIFIPLIILLPLVIKAQQPERGLYGGLDVAKTLFSGIQRSVTVEPAITYVTPNGTTINFITGFSDFKPGVIYKNLNYQSKGFYFKAGVGKFVNKVFETSLMLGYTNFTEVGTTTFTGNYYDDFNFRGEQKHQLFFTEIQGNFWIALSEKFYLVPNIRIDVMLKTPEGKYYTPFYAPGVGILEPSFYSNVQANLQSAIITGGISARLIYKIF